MTIKTFIAKFRCRLREFRKAERGNVAFIFTLAVIPMMGFVGAAVDYSRANSIKTAMQAAIDATALMLSKDVTTLTQDQITQKTTAYFQALFNHPEATGVTITPTYTNSGTTQLVITGSANVATTFMKAMGMSTLNVNVTSTVTWGATRLRVALVLDNTGSMTDNNKIGALKTATNNLLTQLKSAANQNGDVYVSIVPFVKDVNVDSVNYNANWIDWTDWETNNQTLGTCSKSGNNSQSSCNSAGTCSASSNTTQITCAASGTCSKSGYTTQITCVAQNVCSNPTYTTRANCTSHSGTWAAAVWTPSTWTPATWTFDHSQWNGCIVDRGDSGAPNTNNYDTNVVVPNPSIKATLFSAEQYGSCPQAVKPLSYDWSGMTTLVNNMAAAGNTNQAIGLALGWMSLVGGGPFPTPPAMDPNYKYTQVIILLTDGLNTQDRWYTSQTSIDNRQKKTCDNIYAAGITLYTIQVNTGGDPTSTLLQNCAGTPGTPGKYPDTSKFFLLTSANAIVTTFQQIGTQLSNLRVSK